MLGSLILMTPVMPFAEHVRRHRVLIFAYHASRLLRLPVGSMEHRLHGGCRWLLHPRLRSLLCLWLLAFLLLVLHERKKQPVLLFVHLYANLWLLLRIPSCFQSSFLLLSPLFQLGFCRLYASHLLLLALERCHKATQRKSSTLACAYRHSTHCFYDVGWQVNQLPLSSAFVEELLLLLLLLVVLLRFEHAHAIFIIKCAQHTPHPGNICVFELQVVDQPEQWRSVGVLLEVDFGTQLCDQRILQLLLRHRHEKRLLLKLVHAKERTLASKHLRQELLRADRGLLRWHVELRLYDNVVEVVARPCLALQLLKRDSLRVSFVELSVLCVSNKVWLAIFFLHLLFETDKFKFSVQL